MHARLSLAPFLVSSAAFANLECRLRDECDGCTASRSCKWGMRELVCADATSDCVGGIAVTSAAGCPADGLNAFAPVVRPQLPYELPINPPPGDPSDALAADYDALFGGNNDKTT